MDHEPLVLLADDAEDILEAHGEILRDAGYRVAVARNGEEAVAQALALRPDVVLMDLSMPVMNGIDATREVTASVPTVRVIVLTTSTKGQDVHDAAAAGAVGFLSKGADPDDVLDAIRATADGGTAWDRRAAEILRRAC